MIERKTKKITKKFYNLFYIKMFDGTKIECLKNKCNIVENKE